MKKQINSRKQNGFSILEVVIGIFIFAVGLLALAALQGALTRSMADSKLRTAAVNLGDRAIERQRGFTRLLTAVTPGEPHAYNDIKTPATDPIIVLNGVTYTIDMDVTDYYYELASDTFTSTPITGATFSDYKQVEVTVSWDAVQDFRADEGTVITADEMNTGSIKLTATIPALITSASARIADETKGGEAIVPPISYTPGLRPDIIPLALGDTKFKESLKPMPDVIRENELIETRFDVITYSQSGGPDSAVFLRREEFATVSCECTLKTDGAIDGRRPAIWAGDEYAGGHFVSGKAYGVSANNQQSSVCDSCCTDHHDGGSAADEDSGDEYSNVYGPFKTSSEYPPGKARKEDHNHFKEDGVTEAGNGEKYIEACRLVRVDGFFRVAQDFRREDQYIFPEDFFAGSDAKIAADVTTYSTYVTGAVRAYEGDVADGYPTRATLPCIGGPGPCVAQPTPQADYPTGIGPFEFPSWSELPFGASPPSATQQLRSRGVYIDYMSSDLRWVLGCVDDGGTAEDCQRGDVVLDKTGIANYLEILPFFDVQLTFLNRWNENPVDTPVDATNEGIETNNTHSRGEVSWDANGCSVVKASSHRGNLGFTDTPAIDDVYDDYVTDADLEIYAGSGGTCSDSEAPRIAGALTESVPGSPTIDVVAGLAATCGQTGADWWCNVGSDEVTITGYGKIGKNRYACVAGWTGTAVITLGETATTTFILSAVPMGGSYTINIQNTSCP